MFPSPTAQALAATFHRTSPGQNLESPPMDEDRPCNIVENPWGFIALKHENEWNKPSVDWACADYIRFLSAPHRAFQPGQRIWRRSHVRRLMCGLHRPGVFTTWGERQHRINHESCTNLFACPKLSAACASCGSFWSEPFWWFFCTLKNSIPERQDFASLRHCGILFCATISAAPPVGCSATTWL